MDTLYALSSKMVRRTICSEGYKWPKAIYILNRKSEGLSGRGPKGRYSAFGLEIKSGVRVSEANDSESKRNRAKRDEAPQCENARNAYEVRRKQKTNTKTT